VRVGDAPQEFAGSVIRDPRQLALFACFWLSGFAALLFQVAWTREFAFVFGTSELAIATVLAGFMGGLTAGAALAGRFASKIQRPVLLYAILEGAIAVSALLVPYAIETSTAIVVMLFGGQPELPSAGGLATGSFYVVSSLAILFVPTACMGATLPVLTRFAVDRDDEIASRVGALYAVNTAGSVIGALVAAFWLLPTLGLRGSILAGACVNLAIFGAGVWLARLGDPLKAGESAVTPKGDNSAAGSSHLVLALIAISGMVSFSYEILWARLLSHVLGGSVQSFATMLASFLSGIALGSSIASRFARTPAQAAGGFVIAQLGIAGFSVLCFAFADWIPALAASLEASRDSPVAQISIGLAVLLPAATCIGATLPFAVGVLARSAENAASATARCYAWNTLGAIVGALGTGFFLLPTLGFYGMLLLSVSLNLGIAAAATRLRELDETSAESSRLRAVPLVIAGVLACAALLPTPERLLTASPLQLNAAQPTLLHHLVGRSASVATVLTPHGELEIRTNGLKEAALRRPGESDGLAYAWLPGLAAALRPEARDLLVVGFGGGALLESVPGNFERIDVVEIEEQVLEANRRVGHLRAIDPFADPRLRIVTNDVRGALVLTERKFDAIVSQPSHPWTEGASHLYTREFFSLAAEHLNPAGILVQWVGIDFLDGELFRATLASLRGVFAHVEVYVPYPFSEVYFAASEAPMDWKSSGQIFIDQHPKDAARLGIFGVEDLLSALRMVDAATQDAAHGTEAITDARNAYQFRTGGQPSEVRELLDATDPLVPEALEGLDIAYLKRRIGPRGEKLVAPEPTGEPPAVLAAAQQLADVRDWRALERLDGELARISARHPSYGRAAQFRAAWRLEGGDPVRAREAVVLLDPLILLVNNFDVYLWRARAFALAGSPAELVGALRQLASQFERRRSSLAEPTRKQLVSMARDLMRYIPPSNEYAEDRRRLNAQLRD